MPRENYPHLQKQRTKEEDPVFRGERNFGDGLSGEMTAARLQGFYVDGLDYRDVQVDVDGKLVTSGGGGGGGGPATIADGADVAEGATSDAAVVTDASGTVSGKLRGLVKWAYERMPASLGQKAKAASFPVVIASDQDALAVTGPLTDAQLRAVAVPVSGTVTASGPLTDAQLRAVPVPVSGTVSVTEPVTVDGTVGVSGAVDTELPAAAALTDNMANPTVPAVGAHAMVWDGAAWDRQTQPLTDTQLRATAVPVSGPLTDAQLRATAVPVSGTVTVTATDLDVRNLDVAQDDVRVGGMAAHDAAVADNPVAIGGRASTALPSPVSADGEAVWAWLNRNGAVLIASPPHVGLNSDPYNLLHEAAQYTTTQTTTVLIAGGASEKIVVTKVQIQVGGTTAGTLQLFFGTSAFSRGTSRAIFDGEFAPSATLKPGVVMDGPFISGTNGDDLLVTTSAAINPLTINVWYYIVT